MVDLPSNTETKDIDLEEEEIDDIRTVEHEESHDNDYDEESDDQDYINLKYNNEAFNEEDVIKFMRKIKPILISVIGDSGSGKSSLIQCIYERFQQGKFSNKEFNSSYTLVGLDRRSHYARLNSRSNGPTISRTSISEGVKHFHLCVKDEKEKYHLLISDRAGESYSKCRDTPEIVNDYIELQMCDMVIILLDGAKLIQSTQRTKAINSVQKTVMLLCDNLTRNNSYSITIIVSKFDLIQSYNEMSALQGKLENFFGKMKDYTQNHNIDFSHDYISTRNSNSTIEFGHGLCDLFNKWCQHKEQNSIILEINKWTGPIRQIDKLV